MTLAEERCRARFADAPGATWAWHCHHDWLCEPLTAMPTGRNFSGKIVVPPHGQLGMHSRLCSTSSSGCALRLARRCSSS